MRILFALAMGALLTFSTGFAYDDDCCCVCSGSPARVGVSDNRDGYFLQNGKVMVFRDGNISELTQEMAFGNGLRLEQDGTLILADGTRQRLADNQWLSMDGRFFDRDMDRDRDMRRAQNTRDGFFLQNGKVMTFRNGAITEMTVETTLDNGARILPDGTLVQKDGSRSHISANQFVTMDGQLNVQTHRENTAKDVSHDRYGTPQNTTRESVNATHQETIRRQESDRDQPQNKTPESKPAPGLDTGKNVIPAPATTPQTPTPGHEKTNNPTLPSNPAPANPAPAPGETNKGDDKK